MYKLPSFSWDSPRLDALSRFGLGPGQTPVGHPPHLPVFHKHTPLCYCLFLQAAVLESNQGEIKFQLLMWERVIPFKVLSNSKNKTAFRSNKGHVCGYCVILTRWLVVSLHEKSKFQSCNRYRVVTHSWWEMPHLSLCSAQPPLMLRLFPSLSIFSSYHLGPDFEPPEFASQRTCTTSCTTW